MTYYGHQEGHGPQPFIQDRWTPAVKKLVLANVIVFVLQSFTQDPNANNWMLDLFALRVSTVVKEYAVWQFFTYMFLHGSMFHILLNMLGLWMFGSTVERRLGTRGFLWLYFGSGIAGGLLHFTAQLFTGHWSVPMIGASGACFGVFLAFATLCGDAIVLAFLFFPMRARTAALLFVAVSLFSGFKELQGMSSRIAHFAHLGGALFGYLYVKWPLVWARSLPRLRLRPGGFKPKIHRETSSRDDLSGEVDRILNKIHEQGVGSLTQAERQTLDEASKEL